MKIYLIIILITVCLSNPSVTLSQTKFEDVSRDHWAHAEIYYLKNNNVVNGFEDNTFRPSSTVTRAEAAAMMVNTLGFESEERVPLSFTDVHKDHYAYDAIALVADEGIMIGSGKQFYPNTPMSREQMAAIIDRAFGLNSELKMKFKDLDSLNPFYSSIQNLAGSQISIGYPDRTFRPKHPISRGEFSVLLTRAINDTYKIEKPQTPDLAYFADLIENIERNVEVVSSHEPMRISELESVLQFGYTEEMKKSMWRSYYNGVITKQLFFNDMQDLKILPGLNYVVMIGSHPNGDYFEYTLVLENNRWLIDDVSGNY